MTACPENSNSNRRPPLIRKGLWLAALLLAAALLSQMTAGAGFHTPRAVQSPAEGMPARPLMLQSTSTPTPTPTATPVSRFRLGFGIDLNYGALSQYDVTQLGAGWYSDWYSQIDAPKPGCLEYAQLIYCDADAVAVNMTTRKLTWAGWAALDDKIAANPGSMWFIGNEPDCTWPDCDNRLPEEYAVIYHEFYNYIKARDPSARIANGAIVEGTPMRLEYLDRVWSAYQTYYGAAMPVDVWNMHNQIAREQWGDWGAGVPPGFPLTTPGALYLFEQNDSIEIFIQHIRNMRTWMKNHGQQNKPLVISEYGVLFTEDKGFTVDRVNEFMTNTFRYLLYATDASLGYAADGNRLVQRWIWFSINEPPTKWNGALFDYTVHAYPGVITRYGQNYQSIAADPYRASPTPWGTPAPATTIREAEAGSLAGDMRIVADTAVSNCAYVDTPSTSAGGNVQVSAYLPEAGNYYVQIRMQGPDVSSNSFWVSVDDGIEYAVERAPANGWGWQRVMNPDYTLVVYTLGAGWHRVKVNQKEIGARVDAIAMSNNPNLAPGIPKTCQTPTPTPSPTPPPSYSIPLHAGWNLVSFPINPASTNPRAVLASVDGSYDLAYAWDGASQSWRSFLPNLPDPLQSLKWLTRLQGFWIHATQPATLNVTGCPAESQSTVLLKAGWNMVGFPAGSARDIATALAPIAGKYTLVFAYDPARPDNPWRKYNPAAPSFANDLTLLEPGKGYWLKVSEACAWTIAY